MKRLIKGLFTFYGYFTMNGFSNVLLVEIITKYPYLYTGVKTAVKF